MFTEHNFVIWGTDCPCGGEAAILQTKFHPWGETDLIIKVRCLECGQFQVVDRAKAAEFYNQKIYRYFTGLHGQILDLGCGGGFLTRYLVREQDVTNICAIDIDSDCEKDLEQISDPEGKITFKNLHLNQINQFQTQSIDYLVHRDLFMFVEDPQDYFDNATRITRKGIRHMGWFKSVSERMQNHLLPGEIAAEYRKRGWEVELQELDWYMAGYYIKAERK